MMFAFTGTALAAEAPEVTGSSENLRTGWYQNQASLSPEGVFESGHFAEAFKTELIGQVYAQPLVANGTLVVGTEEDWVYGIDPYSGRKLWSRHLGEAVKIGPDGSGETVECHFLDLSPRVGITGTPLIDTEKNLAYFVSNQYVSGHEGEIAWYMHAINLSDGSEAAHFPVRLEGESNNLPGAQMRAKFLLQRPALLKLGNVIYASFGSHCINPPWQGWIVGVTPTGNVTTRYTTALEGASLWQAGAGPVSDGPNRIIFATGNAPFESNSFPLTAPGNEPPEGRLSESVVQAEVQPDGSIKAKDFFSPSDNEELDEHDWDVGSSGPLALPPVFGEGTAHPKLLAQIGKKGTLFLLDREHLGGRDQGGPDDNDVVQQTKGVGGVWDGLAAWGGEGGYVYVPTAGKGEIPETSGGSLNFFKYENVAGNPKLTLAATTEGAKHFAFGSGSPIVTSDGTKSGSAIVWTTWCPGEAIVGELHCEGAELRAYEAAPSVGSSVLPKWSWPIGQATKFSRPVAANGHVYVANNEGETAPASGVGTKSSDAYGFGFEEEPAERATHEREASAEREAHATLGREIAAREAAEEAIRIHEETVRREHEEQLAREAMSHVEGFITPLVPPSVEHAPTLTALKLRATASKLSSSKGKLSVGFKLSAAGRVLFVVQRKQVSHHCPKHAHTCVLWPATKNKLKLSERAGANTASVSLAGLKAGSYRLAATPSSTGGTSGATSYLSFTVQGAARR